jgi:hypothetical protein
MLKALAAAEKVARYRHAQLSAVKLAGDINARVADDASLDELLAKIEGELENLKPILGPIIDLEVAREARRSHPRAVMTRRAEGFRAANSAVRPLLTQPLEPSTGPHESCP